MVDLINFDIEGKRNVMAQQLKSLIRQQVADVVFRARIEIVDTEHFVTLVEQIAA